ncbi:cupin [Candidatus Shapirobacteria bacterium CG10_big_fil_rev_8_21_14_0_10_40_9]|uniref:Cupin n=1 Tax=Candidatus Shapirobacteria bacterium CG10_big_fil_rev_8_21_14_0_10_40_9 TaxID=1974888 RepID=A0A2M8L3W8_9BACT|nr:MAG: cupin [Candidatus Shapirobacteria bacterium CG10_big_fil_rev_8_21_14_0_10_40_9]
MKPSQLKIEKPWGYELLLTPPESPVTGKILHLNEGCRFSLQYHDKKQETLTLISGEAEIILEDENKVLQTIKMESKKGYFIKPFQKHRAKGITDCDILEASTKEEGKTVRLEDDYSRGTETEEERKKRGQSGTYMG